MNTSNNRHPAVVFDDAGTYPVSLVIRNKWDCPDTLVKTITVMPDLAVYIPNAFTPNNDGHNELFLPVMRGIKQFTFSIFDRWGHKIFETSDPNGGWDGTFKGEPCPQDVYAWKLQLAEQGRNLSGSTITRQPERTMAGQVLLYK